MSDTRRLAELLMEARQLMVMTTPGNMGGAPDLFWPPFSPHVTGEPWEHYENLVNDLADRIDRALPPPSKGARDR